MHTLYPPIAANHQFELEVTPPHKLYVEECGSGDGIPVVFLHGGPGSGCEPYHRQFFDPKRYRIILFDQRGAGRSTPHAMLENNTTQDLVADIEAIRQHLNIDRWLVFGGSWGSTLALVYAQTHPQRVLGLVLRGVFLCRKKEIDWFYQQGGASRIFPDVWESFVNPIPAGERHDMLSAYHKRLTGEDEISKLQAAKAWSLWEGRTSSLIGSQRLIDHFGHAHTALSLARIECHYFMNDSFLSDNQILNNIDALQDIPGVIVQGRYDVICPMESAWELHKAWPNSILKIIPNAGHSATEAGICSELVQACDQFAADLTKR